MRKRVKYICLFLAAVLLLTGCMKTADQLYRLPKRSGEFTKLQTVIDEAMTDLNYCVPRSGENQQAVQMTDLNGDGTEEYLVYANNDSQSLLSVLIFRQTPTGYMLALQLLCNGTSFDMVEYAQLDDRPGKEIVIGSQLSEKLQRNAEVYTFSETLESNMLFSAPYAECLVLDLNQDDVNELFLLKPATEDAEPGVVELYRMADGSLNRTDEARLSAPIENLKRVITGNIHGGTPAVYAATAVNDTSIITDVYILKGDKLHNVTLSDDSGNSMRTQRSHYIYADDLDNDGVIELPYSLPMMPMDHVVSGGNQELIRWYAMKSNGEEVIKAYTFHNFTDGWYLQLDEDWAHRLTVVAVTGAYELYIWDDAFESAIKVLTVLERPGTNRSASSTDSSEILLYESESLRLTAQLEVGAEYYGLNETSLKDNFRMIRQNWKTGEI